MKQTIIYMVALILLCSNVLGYGMLPELDKGQPTIITNVTSNNYIIINVTNNITTYTNFTNNISMNYTNYVNFTNNITNDITTYLNITNNVTNNITIDNNYYSGWLTIVNNNTINITNNNTYYLPEMTINITNNITENINNIVNITTSGDNSNITLINNIYNISNNFTEIYNDTNIFNAINYVNTTTNIENLGFNTTLQLKSYFDTNYYSIFNPTKYLNNTIFNNLTNNYIVEFQNNSLTNSPIKHTITDEDTIKIYDDLLYIDNTNSMIGININDSETTYSQTFQVTTKIKHGLGNINSTTTYDIDTNSTLVILSSNKQLDLVDASNIYVNGQTYFVFSKINTTYFYLSGNITNLNFNSWSYQQAPYIDVNGASNTERGYSISSNGTWVWATGVQADSNNSRYCLQSNETYFNNGNDAWCVNSNGNMEIFGNLLTQGFYAEIFNTTSTTKTMTTRYVYYNLTSYESSDLNGWIYLGNGYLQCNQSGNYNVDYSINSAVDNNDVLYYKLFKNDIEINKSLSIIRYANGKYEPITFSFYLSLNKDDIINLRVADQTRNGATLSEDNRNIRLNRIGN